MNMTKDECSNCGATSTLRDPDGNIKCLECGYYSTTAHATWQHPSPVSAITVGRYCKADGFPTRHYAIHLDGVLLAVTVFRKGAEAVRTKLLELLDGREISPALPTCKGEGCILTPEQRSDLIPACDGAPHLEDPGPDSVHLCPLQTPASVELARENGFFRGC